MLTITSAAAVQIKAAAEQSDAQGMALRLAAQRVGDGPIQYGMGFDDERDQDERIEHYGVTVLVGAPSMELLQGATLDYVEIQPGQFQFVLDNPNESAASCPPSACGGCGSKGGCGSAR
jgi:iron-sulfur cluster assembly protein